MKKGERALLAAFKAGYELGKSVGSREDGNDITKEIARLCARIEQLEAELRQARAAAKAASAKQSSSVVAFPTRRVIREPELVKMLGITGMTLRRMEKAGHFPKRFKINPDGGTYGAVGWDYAEVMEWIEKRNPITAPAS